MVFKKRVLILILLILSISIALPGFCKVRFHSHSELMEMSDLVIKGRVTKIEPSNEIKNMGLLLKGRVSYAALEVIEVLKGEAFPPIIVEFVKFDDFVGGVKLEPDCQNAQFESGEEGIAYLRKLKNGHYEGVAGWLQGFKRTKRANK